MQPTTNFSLPEKQHHPIISITYSFTFSLPSNICIYLCAIPLFISFTQKKNLIFISRISKQPKISPRYVGFSGLFVSVQVSHIQIGKPKPSYLLTSSLFLGLLFFFHSFYKTRQILPAPYQFEVGSYHLSNISKIIFWIWKSEIQKT